MTIKGFYGTMTTLYVSHVNVEQDNLGRWVTTLTQEIMTKINEHEEQILIGTIKEINEQEEVVAYCNDDYTEFDVLGSAINKAIQTINSIAGVTFIAPVTKIDEEELYKVEIEY